MMTLDHLVMTVKSIEQTIGFYNKIGICAFLFNGHRHALAIGKQKINLHQAGQEFTPHAKKPTPGSLDLCFLTAMPLQKIISKLDKMKISIIEGPVKRTGAQGDIYSIYIHDPDGNLIEISNQITA